MEIEFRRHGHVEPNVASRLWSLPTALAHLRGFVADKAGEAGKSARLTIRCPNLLVSPKLIEAVVPAVVQLLRNAIEHGVEPVTERLVAGKALTAKLTIDVAPEDNDLLIRVIDDGRGIDARTVVAAGSTAGLAGSGANVRHDDSLALLFEAGVRIRRRHGADGGGPDYRRGQGLRRAAMRLRKLKGRIGLGSEPGRGTTATIRVSLGGAGPIVVPGIEGALLDRSDEG